MGPSYELRLIDEAVFQQCRLQRWANDLVSQYADYEKYKQLGLGVVVLKDGELAAGASSYTRYKEGLEIEIDTREDYRRKGLAAICGAKLILECLDRGLYPSWDAQNLWSKALAEKLGIISAMNTRLMRSGDIESIFRLICIISTNQPKKIKQAFSFRILL